MSDTHNGWTVLPHGALSPVGENILTVVGDISMPLMELPRRMTVVRLADRRLVIFSAIALDEPAMQLLEDFGQPAYLVVPNDHHRIDAHAWKVRYPQIEVVAPEGARAKIEQTVSVDTSFPDFRDANVQFISVPGTNGSESALLVRDGDGSVLVLNDLVGNIRNASGIGGWLLRMMAFAGDKPRIPLPVRWTLHDKQALREQFMQWAQFEPVKCILVSHGSIIEDRPAVVLRELADSLK
jgi:hypothetical protein